MTEEEISQDPHFIRGKWMLDNQVHGPDTLIQFWSVFGLYVH